jgi:hydrogenase-4 component F
MDAILLLGLLIPPLIAALAALVQPRAIGRAAWFNAATMPLSVAAAAVIALKSAGGAPPLELGRFWRMDALSALLALLISAVAALASWLGPGLAIARTAADGAAAEARSFRIYANLFAATMLLAVSTSNLGVMWVAVEATTVTSALLIAIRRTKASVEASWKYLLIGSVGIALAFTGTVLAFVDYTSTGGNVQTALNWTTLLAAAPSLHPEVARLAFVFLLVGFGTKAGLVPMHTWLPDAHSEAPAALSGMMSGVLLAVALYALARWKVIIDTALGSAFADTLMLIVAVLTILVGSVSLVTQSHYKRLLAYSSVEHIGLACFGLALGPLGTFAALLHLTCHALAKSTAFLLSGRVLERYRTHAIASAPGLLVAMPGTGGLFAAGVLALVGLPPFGLFLSEVLIVRAGWTSGHVVLTGMVLILMLVAFGSLVHHLQQMLFGQVPIGVATGESSSLSLAVLAVPLVVLAWIGTAMPSGLHLLLTRAAAVLSP